MIKKEKVKRFFKKCDYRTTTRLCQTNASYRPWTIVTVTLLIEHMFWLHWEDFAFKAICLSVNAGCFGVGRSIISLLSIEITIDTVGLSVTNSCTHKRPTCMHLKFPFQSMVQILLDLLMLQYCLHSTISMPEKNKKIKK